MVFHNFHRFFHRKKSHEMGTFSKMVEKISTAQHQAVEKIWFTENSINSEYPRRKSDGFCPPAPGAGSPAAARRRAAAPTAGSIDPLPGPR